MSVGDIKDFVELVEMVEGTPLEILIPAILIGTVFYSLYKIVIGPVYHKAKALIAYIQKRRFARQQFHENLSFMNSDDVYHSIRNYVPTRYTSKDPANNDEPIPEYLGEEAKREPLLISHFMKYEFDQKYGRKYYLCLGDCGSGKTTFLINLYYEILRQKKKLNSAFITLQDSNCIGSIEKIKNPEKTILLLDALDENENAVTNFDKFMTDLENATRKFYRVIITSRTNFFVTEEKEHLSSRRSGISTSSKLLDARKYYIAPFTDEDIQRYLKQRYRGKKYQQAWELMETYKNLSVRPMLLRYMDELLVEKKSFRYVFQLYEYLFVRWIEREKGALSEDLAKGLYDECILLAKSIYHLWRKTGRVGIFTDEFNGNEAIPGLSQVKFKGHALLNRTSEGMYKFAHKSFWEYLLAKIAMQDVYFADDLLVRNFDQAEAFWWEMISSGEFRTCEGLLGAACYHLKYKKPEDAQELIQNACRMEMPEDMAVFAKVLLTRSYQRQFKEASAEREILQLYPYLKDIEITPKRVPLLTKFGMVLAVYARQRRLRMGQEYLGRLIDYCRENDVTGYDMLICCERYSYCALNCGSRERMLEQMRRCALREERDLYAEYWVTLASIWGAPYQDPEALQYDIQLVNKYGKLKDSYESMVDYCRLACGMMAVYDEHRDGNFDSVQDAAVEFMGKAHDICTEIYDSRYETIHNPYTAQLTMESIRYMGYLPYGGDFPKERQKEDASRLLQYCREYSLEDEMQVTYCRIMEYAADHLAENDEQKKQYQLLRVQKARSMHWKYEEIMILWNFELGYGEDNSGQNIQRSRRQTLELARTDSDFMETRAYCLVLRYMMMYSNDAAECAEAYQELCQITHGIYGNDRRGARIYHSLAEYAFSHHDRKAIEHAQAALRCSFDMEDLQQLYLAYYRFSDNAHFLADLESILYGLPEITTANMDEIEEFLESRITYETRENPYVILRLPSEFCDQVRDTVGRIKREKEQARFSRRFSDALHDTRTPVLS